MKFTLSIQDLTEEQVRQTLSHLTNTPQVSVQATAPQLNVAPIAPVETPNLNAPSVDSKGLPWDERIHSSSKGINADGSWKKRRGVDDATITQVEAELRGGNVQHVYEPPMPLVGGPGSPVLANAPEAFPQNAAPAPVPSLHERIVGHPAQPAPVAPQAAPVPMATPAAAPVVEQSPFAKLMTKISGLIREGRVASNYPETHILSRIRNDFGVEVNAITDISSRPDLVDYALQCIEVDGFGG